MSEETKVPAPAAKPKAKVKKPNFFKRAASGTAKWFNGMRSELKKVVWPTKKQTTNNTLVVLVLIVVSSLVLWGLDSIASTITQLLIAIGG